MNCREFLQHSSLLAGAAYLGTPALGAKLCIKQGGAWQEVMPLDTEEGSITLTGLSVGKHEYSICIEAQPVSQPFALTVVGDETGVSPMREAERSHIICRLNGTRTASTQETGLYIKDGKKILINT